MPHATSHMHLPANVTPWTPNMCQMSTVALIHVPTVNECEKLRCQNSQLANCSVLFAFGACKRDLVVPYVDSCAFLNPNREFWFRKGWHNRIRHADPPKSNLFQLLKLTQQATAHDPSPPRRQKMCNRLQMQAPGLLGCVGVGVGVGVE